MFAIVFEYSVTPENQAEFDAQAAQYLAVREQQPGFLGTIEVAIGEGRIAVLNLWESQEAQQAAQQAMTIAYERIDPLYSAQMVGRGEVLHNTISART
jgi:heme-degrading monooxygenase HmoA